MPRPHRLDFRDAIHYVLVSGRKGRTIFFDAAVLRHFPIDAAANVPPVQKLEQLIGEACKECGTLLHAYSVEPNALALVLRAAGAPLNTFMARVCGQYSRYWRGVQAASEERSPFGHRYESKIIATEYLPHAIRRAHSRPILVGLCRRPIDYPFGSARAYLGARARVPLDLGAARAVLERRGLFGTRGYREFMDRPESDFVARLFERGSELDARVVGNKPFVMKAWEMAARPRPAPTRGELVAAVARLIQADPAEAFMPGPAGVLGRSLVAWYGVRTGAASLEEIGRWFSLSGTALRRGIRRHRRGAPELFGLSSLPGLEYSSGTRIAHEKGGEV